MHSCEFFQAEMLDDLYGLLDGADAMALAEHVAGCQACQTALAQARRQQQLLAVAAKTAFPAVTFQPPLAPVAAKPKSAHAFWGAAQFPRWGVAALIMVTLAGAVLVPVGYAVLRYQVSLAELRMKTTDEATQRAEAPFLTRLGAATGEVQTVQKEIERQLAERDAKVEETRRARAATPLRMSIFGPPSVEAGGNSQFEVRVENRWVPSAHFRLTAQILDANHKPLQRAVDVQEQSTGRYRVALPGDLPLKPDSDFYLALSAREQSGASDTERRLTMTEKLRLTPPLFVTHLATDKPMYQPGESVRFRSLTLERFSLKPAQEEFHLNFDITDPRGEHHVILSGAARLLREQSANLILGPDKKPLSGIGTGEYVLGPDAPGGEYTLTVSEAATRFAPEKRKFLVNRYEKPRLNKELEFARKSYGRGDEVVSACKVARVEGGAPVAHRPVTATIKVDGKTYGADGKEGSAIHLQTDAAGEVSVKFRLPQEIDRGDATLAVTFEDGGSVETLVRPIPIVLSKLQVEFFPEGGDLIAGVPNRVYFQARTPLDKPAELKGRIVDDQGRAVAMVKTFNDPGKPGANQGMGSFEFTPQVLVHYQLRIDTPLRVEGHFRLPIVRDDGVLLRVRPGVVSATDPIRLTLTSVNRARVLVVGAYCRGRLMAQERVEMNDGEARAIELQPERGVGAVYRITAYEEVPGDSRHPRLVPRAERLIYRAAPERLNLAVRADKAHYVPGDRVKLHFVSTDEKARPAPAVAMVAVVDKSVVKLADEKTYRSMPTHFLLTMEVRRPEDLEYADFLLGSDANAPVALDLLLGTQGWRRFAEQDPAEFRRRLAGEADRLLVSVGQLSPSMGLQTTDFDAEAIRRVSDEFRAKSARLRETLAKAQAKQAEIMQERQRAQAEPAGPYQMDTAARVDCAETVARLERYEHWMRDLVMVAAVVAGVLVIVRVVRLIGFRRVTIAMPYVLGATGCVVLIVVGMYTASERGKFEGAVNLAQMEAQTDHRAPPRGGVQKMAAPRRGVTPATPLLGGGQLPDAGKLFPEAPGSDAPLANLDLGYSPPNRALRDDRWRAADGVRRGRLQVQVPGNAWHAADPAWADGLHFPRDRSHVASPLAVGGRGAGPADDLGPPPCVLREYAHHRTSGSGDIRSDFAETLYWNPVLILPNGEADASFELCDSVTTFQVLVTGHTTDGRLGSAVTELESRLPLTAEPKLPIEVTASDKLAIPVSVANNTSVNQSVAVRLQANGLSVGDDPVARLNLAPNARVRQLFRLQPTIQEGDAEIRIDADAASIAADRVVRSLRIVPDGFPVSGVQSDLLDGVAVHDFTLPQSWILGTLKYQVAAYPSTLADLQKGLESLFREPNGCFEQTSSSNYPNLLTLDYLQETDQAKPELARRAKDMLSRGYQKLTSFECLNTAASRREGYEWFGGTAPPHEALTAYGLMQFRDMGRVYDVDRDMVERTKTYLLSRRDHKGGFMRNQRGLDHFGHAPDHITNAYIVWALTENSKEDDVTQELDALARQAAKSKDPYFLALVVNSLLNRDRNDDALSLLTSLSKAQQKDGHLDAAQTSITGSGGRDLQIETTALSLLAWLKAKRPDQFNRNVESAVRWLGQQRGGYGGFGATQSTVLALKALIAHARENKKTVEAGDIVLLVGDQVVARHHFDAGAQEALISALDDAEKHLKPGKNHVRIEVSGRNAFPYTASWSCQAVTPASGERCPLALVTSLDRATAGEGETVRLSISLRNKTDQGHGMVVAVIGLPAGLTLPEDMKQLKEMTRLRNNETEPGLISAWETRGRELVIYWRDLGPKQEIQLSLELICRVPGEYHGPASRAYLYYNADHKCWVKPLGIVIQAMPAVN